MKNAVIPSRQFEETVAFYRDILGFPVYNEGPGFCFLNGGGAYIAVHKVPPDSWAIPTGHGIYLDVKVSNLEEAKGRLSKAGIGLLKEWEDRNGRFILVADPDGNLVEIYE